MIRVLYPINLDRWQSPVSTSLREITLRNADIDFYSFSHPICAEDRHFGQSLWKQSHIHKISALDIIKERFDIIHHASATQRNLAAVALAKLRSSGKCIHIFTAPIQPHQNDQYYRQYVRSVKCANVLAAVSYAVADDIQAQFGRKVDAVIPSGVDAAFFSPAAAQPLDYNRLKIQQPYILFVGVLTQRKRPDLFMQIASLLPEIDFVMVGKTYNTQDQDLYSRMALEHPNIRLLGALPREDVRNLMANALALVFPSELEGLPLTVLEASAMGLPVLAQPKTSMPEAVIDGVTGWLLSGDSLSDWTEKLQEVLRWSTAERKAFAIGARAFVVQHYSWDRVAQQYGELYRKLAEQID